MVRHGCTILKTIKIMENALIKLEDLRIGDEILISCQSYMKYLRVLDQPRLSPTKKHWSTGAPLYKSVRCSTRQEVTTTQHTWGGKAYTRTHKEWKVTPEDHNIKISQDLSGRQIWLVKRENNDLI
jgi:hypothetical protein